MEPTQELIDDIYRERILRARAIPPATRLLEGLRHSEASLRFMEATIRSRYPEFTDDQVRAEMRRRIDIARKLDSES